MQYPHLKLPPYWGGFQRLVDEIHAEMTGKTPAANAKPAMVKAHRATDAEVKAFWSRPTAAKKPVGVMIKARGPTRGEVRRAAPKLAGYVAEANALARSGKLSGSEGAQVDAQIARMAKAVAAL
jgi:hypothetical protein